MLRGDHRAQKHLKLMLINGVNIIFVLPPVLLVLTAIAVGGWRFSTRGPKAAGVSFVRIIVYGGFILFVLFLVWASLYYAGGGH
jgi:hypothetical protein